MSRRITIANHNQPTGTDGDHPDRLQPFMLETSQLRGRMVRLNKAANTIITYHDYPEPVARLLGEALSLTALLAGMLKFDGVFTFQVKGMGPVTMIVCDLTNAGHLRGYASFDADMIAAANLSEAPSLTEICGEGGYLAFTVDQKNAADRYQGIVPLQGDTLSDAVRYYFQQSEQIKTGFDVAVGQRNGVWHTSAIMLQEMPPEGGNSVTSEADVDDWRRAMMLLETASAAELLDNNLPINGMLYRLFHEEGVRVFDPLDIVPKCRCNRKKIAPIIEGLPYEEQLELAEKGKITVTCEFCNKHYHFPVEPPAN
ncbi:MAG TPA: Hsp33 family molecular chaperone HslO [Alphaproteobacteria bacterium]